MFDNLKERRIERLCNSTKYKDKMKLVEQVESGKISIDNKKVLNAYLETIFEYVNCIGAFKYLVTERLQRWLLPESMQHLRFLIRNNISITTILENEKIKQRLFEEYKGRLNFLNNEDIDFLLENDVLKTQLIDYIGKDLIEEIGHKMQAEFLNQKNESLIEPLVTLIKLGYNFEKLTNDELLNLMTLDYFSEKKVKKINLIQVSMQELGLLNPDIVNKMYHLKFDYYKEQYKDWQTNRKYSEFHVKELYISNSLLPSEDNKMANYWKKVSEVLNDDFMLTSLKIVSSFYKPADSDVFGENSAEENYQIWITNNSFCDNSREKFYSNYDENVFRVFDNGLPTKLFWNKIIRKITHFNHEGHCSYNFAYIHKMINLISLFSMERIEEYMQGFIREYIKLSNNDMEQINEEQKSFLLNITNNHNSAYFSEWFDNNGITDALRKYSLFCGDYRFMKMFFYDFSGFAKINISNKIKQYVDFVIKYKLNLNDYINNEEEISIYFNENGPSEKLYDIGLFDQKLFNIFKGVEWMEHYHVSKDIEQYIEFTQKYGFILTSFIKSKEDIPLYFNDKGPSEKLYDMGLFNIILFDILFKEKVWKEHYHVSGKIEQYIEFTQKYGFILTNLIKSKEDILNYFNTDGFKQKLLIGLLKYNPDNTLLNNLSLGDYYRDLYNFYVSDVDNDLLKRLNDFYNSELIRGNYMVLLKLMVEMDYEPKDISIRKGIPNTLMLFRHFEEKQLNDICKYCLLFTDNSIDSLSCVVGNNNFNILLKIYNFLFDEWNIDDFKALLSNYMNNKELCESIVEYIESASSFIEIESSFFDDKKEKIKKILVYGDINAFGKIMTVNDLNNYEQIIYNENIKLIEFSNSINEIKKSVYNLLFNLDVDSIKIVLSRYNNSKLNNAMTTINDFICKEKLSNISTVLDFIDSLDKERNEYKLKEYLKIINDSYLNNSDIFEELWQHFASLEKELNKILGMEINEKITDFKELIDMATGDSIPVDENGNQLFNVTNKELICDFEYDGKKFKAGTHIPFIELTGLPFVTFGHVLNAYGSGGKVSDFNNPRIIGRTHLCLSAIDDNYYNLVNRPVSDINHVQLLFSNLPANQLAIASEKDVASHSENNSRNITSWRDGNYNSVRENISNTYQSGYNEYVYYRDNIKPSAVLIKGDEPMRLSYRQQYIYKFHLLK